MMMIKQHPIFDLIAGTSKVMIVDDNAKSHGQKNAEPFVPEPPLASPTCRWQSSPVLSTRPQIAQDLKRSSSVPDVSIPSLQSLVSPVRRRSIELQPLDDEGLSASELLSEYLRYTTENLTAIDLGNGEDDEYEDTTVTTATSQTVSCESLTSVSSGETTASLLSNVKKPVRRRSLDAA